MSGELDVPLVRLSGGGVEAHYLIVPVDSAHEQVVVMDEGQFVDRKTMVVAFASSYHVGSVDWAEEVNFLRVRQLDTEQTVGAAEDELPLRQSAVSGKSFRKVVTILANRAAHGRPVADKVVGKRNTCIPVVDIEVVSLVVVRLHQFADNRARLAELTDHVRVVGVILADIDNEVGHVSGGLT